MTENLFARARNESLSTGTGEVELLANAWLRVRDGRDRDNVGDDLNLLVMMLMAKLRNPSPPSDEAGRRLCRVPALQLRLVPHDLPRHLQ